MDDMTMSAISERPVWETLGRDDIESIIRGNIHAVESKMAEITDHFCTTGYYLRRQQREDQWKETGAASFADYVRDTYGKSRGWATRMMQINERYSRDGNDPRLDDKYKAYTVSQLQEMLYLPEDVDGVTPDMTVRQIRAMRPKTEESPEPAKVPAPAAAEEPEVKAGQQAVDDTESDAEQDYLKREITRNEWVRMYEERECMLPEEINADSLLAALIHTGLWKDGFHLECTRRGVTINNSKVETWATAARQLNAIRIAKAKQEAKEAAAAAKPGYCDFEEERAAAAEGQGGQQETPEEEWRRLAKEKPRTEESRCRMNELARMMNQQGDVCDVAKSEGAAAADWKGSQGQQVEVVDLTDFCDVAKPDANIPECTQCQETCGEPGDTEVADEFPQDDLPEKWSMDLQAFVADDQDDGQEGSGQEGSRQQADDGEGAAGVIARNVRYVAWEVDMCARDARKNYDELVMLQNELMEEGDDKLIPWTSIKKARMTADALEMLAATIRIHDAKDEED